GRGSPCAVRLSPPTPAGARAGWGRRCRSSVPGPPVRGGRRCARSWRAGPPGSAVGERGVVARWTPFPSPSITEGNDRIERRGKGVKRRDGTGDQQILARPTNGDPGSPMDVYAVARETARYASKVGERQ